MHLEQHDVRRQLLLEGLALSGQTGLYIYIYIYILAIKSFILPSGLDGFP